MADVRLTVEQRVRDAAVRRQGVQLTGDEVNDLFLGHATIGEKACVHDGRRARGVVPDEDDDAAEVDDG